MRLVGCHIRDMRDERQKQQYDQKWEDRERDRIARTKAARERGRAAYADKIARGAERRRDEKRPGRA
jgi:hypothetical protein